jgi:hypothetical protein
METREPIFHQNSPTEQLVRDTPAAPVTAVASVGKQTFPRRKPLLAGEDDGPTVAANGPKVPTSYIVKTSRPVNQRRGNSLPRLLGLIFLSNLLIIGAFGAWYYNTINDQIEKRLGELPSRPAGQNSSSSQGNAATHPLSNSEIAGLSEKIADLQSQLQSYQKRLAENEQATKALASRAQKAPVVPSPPAVPVAPAVPSPPPVPGTPAAASAPLSDDLLLLKERNRLTAYADEAIATAARAPYEQLWKALDDPRLANLAHASRAEILRVQNYYLSGSRLDRFDIPVGDYYPDSAALRDSQLSDEQLIRLLGNQDHPWQVRLKAANLLGLRRSTVVGDALTKAIKTDPNLDVVKEATFSFEQLTGYRAQLFEIDTLEAWWKQYTDSPPANTPPLDAPKSGSKAREKAQEREAPDAPQIPPTPSASPLPELKLPEEFPSAS